eukprot:GFUD01039139.1.p1 GENE.GFUD01039139.1~~GFUD01039139.1.p1  ORF type:complete len:103 (+),score=25.07 GFUD01039139.1:147-455(+)
MHFLLLCSLLCSLLFSITSTLVVRRDTAMDLVTEQQETTWDPWAPCKDDTDCPDSLMCNIWQDRCTECMDNEDCPPCLDEDCPFDGEPVCVYGDHCCTADFC